MVPGSTIIMAVVSFMMLIFQYQVTLREGRGGGGGGRGTTVVCGADNLVVITSRGKYYFLMNIIGHRSYLFLTIYNY